MKAFPLTSELVRIPSGKKERRAKEERKMTKKIYQASIKSIKHL
jgi:hypothetical protein